MLKGNLPQEYTDYSGRPKRNKEEEMMNRAIEESLNTLKDEGGQAVAPADVKKLSKLEMEKLIYNSTAELRTKYF